MLLDIEGALSEAELIRYPIVYVKPEVDKTLSGKIKEIITSRQGEVVDDEEEATHIIFPTVDPLPEEYARVVFKRDKHVMLHWYYLPDSYDSWVPNNFDLPVSIKFCESFITPSIYFIFRNKFRIIRTHLKIKDGCFLHHGF